jgi:Stress responsive A/B Barrel Domain
VPAGWCRSGRRPPLFGTGRDARALRFGKALGMVSHVVMFRFRDRSPEHLAHCRGLLEALPAKVPQIRHLEVGVNARPSDRAYDLCLSATFDTWEDLAAYQSNPDHLEVATYLRSAMDASGSVDYES